VNLVVDTNIVFSTLLIPHSAIGEILMNVQDNFVFFAPELLKEELQRYLPKIAAYTKLSQEDLINIRSIILSNINFVSEELISENSWVNAFELTKDIDEDDTPFIVLAIELNTKL
jgi:predicted nucleic acid-binding protein